MIPTPTISDRYFGEILDFSKILGKNFEILELIVTFSQSKNATELKWSDLIMGGVIGLIKFYCVGTISRSCSLCNPQIAVNSRISNFCQLFLKNRIYNQNKGRIELRVVLFHSPCLEYVEMIPQSPNYGQF